MERAREAELAALAERQRKRDVLRTGADEPCRRIYELIEGLDRNPNADECLLLKEVVTAAADKFDDSLREALFDLADAGGWTRTETALESLTILGADRLRLGGAALRALARGDATQAAASVVAKGLLPEHRDLVRDALPALIAAAAPSRAPLGLSDHPGDPAGLLAVHRLFPDLVHEVLRLALASHSKDDRIDACEAIKHAAN